MWHLMSGVRLESFVSINAIWRQQVPLKHCVCLYQTIQHNIPEAVILTFTTMRTSNCTQEINYIKKKSIYNWTTEGRNVSICDQYRWLLCGWSTAKFPRKTTNGFGCWWCTHENVFTRLPFSQGHCAQWHRAQKQLSCVLVNKYS